jgi:hypothetical protein
MTLRIMLGFILLVIPGIVMTIRYGLYAPVVLLEGLERKAARLRARQLASRSWRTIIIVTLLQFVIPMLVSALLGRFSFSANKANQGLVVHKSYRHLSGILNIVIAPLISIVPALVYLKMRQLGGEPLSELLTQIENVDANRSQWQQRMRSRLSVHPSHSHRTTSGEKSVG